MTDHEKDLILMVVKHYMPMELRQKLMAEVPTAYNALAGRTIVVSTHNDGRKYP